MAQLPVPRRAGPDPGLRDGAAFTFDPLPDAPRAALRTLIEAGHEAVLVGGCVRDALLGDRRGDWDLATSATPDAVAALFEGATWENRFGTVTLPGDPLVEITSYRTEGGYRDHRRPDEVRFGTSLPEDLARRDFTINAIAWRPGSADAADGTLVDPHGGLADLRDGVIRAVGDPSQRFAEDALRLLRAVRFAHRLGFALDPATERALASAAPSAATLSGERVRDELLRLLADPSVTPSAALGDWERLGLLAPLLPELAALRGIPQGKASGGDALDHSLWTADALGTDDVVLRVAGLLHDVGKATTMADGRFIGHERVGAEMAADVVRRLRFSQHDAERVTDIVRHHMFGYEPAWTDAAVRRFIRRVGRHRVDDLLALRAADEEASGAADAGAQARAELRRRVDEQADAPLELRALAVDGHAIQRELGLEPGPRVGEMLDWLLDRVVDAPHLNDPETLLRLARARVATPSDEAGADAGERREPSSGG